MTEQEYQETVKWFIYGLIVAGKLNNYIVEV